MKIIFVKYFVDFLDLDMFWIFILLGTSWILTHPLILYR